MKVICVQRRLTVFAYPSPKIQAKGEWSEGLEAPWKRYGKTTCFLLLLGLLHGFVAYGVEYVINRMQLIRPRFAINRCAT